MLHLTEERDYLSDEEVVRLPAEHFKEQIRHGEALIVPPRFPRRPSLESLHPKDPSFGTTQHW
jgi:hypothetical protein